MHITTVNNVGYDADKRSKLTEKKMTIHFIRKSGDATTVCGRVAIVGVDLSEDNATTNFEEVTCKRCIALEEARIAKLVENPSLGEPSDESIESESFDDPIYESVDDTDESIESGDDLEPEPEATTEVDEPTEPVPTKVKTKKVKATKSDRDPRAIGELKQAARHAKIKHWQWANKPEIIVLLSDDASQEARQVATTSIESRYEDWKSKHRTAKS